MSHKLDYNQQDIVCIPINKETSVTFVISMDEDNSIQCPHQDCPYTTIKEIGCANIFVHDIPMISSSYKKKVYSLNAQTVVYSRICTVGATHIIIGM
jgi:hypothetical protein